MHPFYLVVCLESIDFITMNKSSFTVSGLKHGHTQVFKILETKMASHSSEQRKAFLPLQVRSDLPFLYIIHAGYCRSLHDITTKFQLMVSLRRFVSGLNSNFLV